MGWYSDICIRIKLLTDDKKSLTKFAEKIKCEMKDVICNMDVDIVNNREINITIEVRYGGDGYGVIETIKKELLSNILYYCVSFRVDDFESQTHKHNFATRKFSITKFQINRTIKINNTGTHVVDRE